MRATGWSEAMSSGALPGGQREQLPEIVARAQVA